MEEQAQQVAAVRVVVAAGGTAGHVVPALAVAGELRALGAEVHFIGGNRAECRLVPAAGFPFHQIPAGGLDRTNPLRAVRGLARALGGAVGSYRLLRGLRPAVVYGAGGYTVASVGPAAVALGIPLVLGEADSHLGLANRLLAPFARRVCLAFPIAGRQPPRFLVCGRPLAVTPPSREQARERLGIGAGDRFVVVFGGSLGARSLNEAALSLLPRFEVAVLHITGEREYSRLAQRPLPDRYRLEPFVEPAKLSEALAGADLVLCRAGGSLLEVAAHGVAMVVVPYPRAAGDHQRANARYVERAGAAVVVEDGELPGGLERAVAGLLADPQRVARMAAAARGLATPQAGRRVAEIVLEAAR